MKVERQLQAQLAGHAADVALRHSHRRRPDRGSRAPVRLRQHSRAATRSRAQTMQPWTETRVRNERAADLLVDRGYQEAITYTFTDAGRRRRCCFPDAAFALAQSDFRRARRHARVAVAGLAAGARQQSASSATARASVRNRPSLRRHDGAETEVIAGVATGPALPEQWGAEATQGRFLRREGGCRSAARTHRRGRANSASSPKRIRRCTPVSRRGSGAASGRRVAGRAASRAFAAARFDISGVRVRARDRSWPCRGRARVPRDLQIPGHPPRYCRDRRRSLARRGGPGPWSRQSAGTLLQEPDGASVYRGRQFEKGKKSIALGLQLQDTSRTLTDNEADAIVAQVVEQLGRKLERHDPGQMTTAWH